MTTALDYDLEVCKFKIQTKTLGKRIKPVYLSSFQWNSILAIILQGWIRH